MSESPILAIPEIGPTQNNKYITHNDAIAALEAASNDIYTNSSVGAGPVALTETQASRYFVYVFSGASAAFDVTMPSTINGNNAKRVFAVRNADTVDALTIAASTGTGADVVLAALESAVIYQNYEDMYVISRAEATTPDSYDLGVYIPGLPDDNVEIMKFTAVRGFSLADDFAGSQGHAGINPTATATFTVKKNGSGIGTVAISSGGTFTFLTSGGAAETFVAGDRLSIETPTPQDATLENVSIVLLGVKT